MLYYAYRLADGQFLRGWPNLPPYDPVTEAIQTYPEHLRPDLRLNRFDANALTKMRLATAQELSDYDDARTIERTQQQFDAEKFVKAVAIWMAGKLNIPLQQAKTEILTILRTL